MTDASGMKLYYTKTLRPNTMAYLIWGPRSIVLPVGATNYNEGGSCPAECTSDEEFPETINIIELIPHMHLYGRLLSN